MSFRPLRDTDLVKGYAKGVIRKCPALKSTIPLQNSENVRLMLVVVTCYLVLVA
jgi:hypothetical protein